jgi:CheY-like chemotaxis protein
MATIDEINTSWMEEILIVDDDPDTCQMLEITFNKKGFHTTVAYSGGEALNYIRFGKPDIVILDVMMPGMDGWETYRRIRLLSGIPVLLLTALSSSDCAAQALSIGVNDYVRKPFHSEELVARTQSLLRLKQSQLAPAYPKSEIFDSLTRPTVSVIIPTLNEAENLPLVLPYLPKEWIDEVILVDGRSTDNTIEVAKKILPSIKIDLEKKPGKGAALLAGYKAASGEILIVLDADGSHDPREIPRFVHSLMEGADFAKGSRFTPGGGTTDMPRIRQLGNQFFVFLINTIFNVHFTDLCYGYHAFWRYCLDIISLEDVDGFEIDTAIYLRALYLHLRVTEVPSFEGYRFRGTGKLRTFPDGWRVLKIIARETKRILFSPCNEFYDGFRGHRPDNIPLLMPPVDKDTQHRKRGA